MSESHYYDGHPTIVAAVFCEAFKIGVSGNPTIVGVTDKLDYDAPPNGPTEESPIRGDIVFMLASQRTGILGRTGFTWSL